MQKNNSKSALNKALIFVSAFVVSSLIIYQVYYYNKVKSLSSGIVATAAELPNTQISPFMPKHFSGSNYMGNAGLLAALGKASESSYIKAPEENYLSGNGVYNKAFLDELNIGISNKFPNHPPIGFPLQEGEKILFSYLFKNVVLPPAFAYTSGMNINGKHFRAIQYMGSGNDSAVKANMVAGGPLKTLIVDIDNGQLVFSKDIISDSNFLAVIAAASQSIKEGILLPEIDFNIIKYWKAEEADFITNARDYKHLEERIKLKLSAQQNEPVENKSKVELQPPFYIYLYKNGSTKPYFSMYVANTELLLPAKGK